MSELNQHVLMSGVDFFNDTKAINAHMDSSLPIDLETARHEHAAIKAALEEAGVKVTQVTPPIDCQDGIYTANWALIHNDRAILSRLPNVRQAEEAYAEKILADLGYQTIKSPLPFSGQGDALPCGKYLFVGSKYRTDARVHQFLADNVALEIVGLQTVPLTWPNGDPVINPITGWADSYFYDLDLAIGIINSELIAWCPEAFTPASQAKIRALPLETIEVPYKEALEGFACNLISTGKKVIMSAEAPILRDALLARGLDVITPHITELAKGGGFIRCTTLTL